MDGVLSILKTVSVAGFVQRPLSASEGVFPKEFSRERKQQAFHFLGDISSLIPVLLFDSKGPPNSRKLSNVLRFCTSFLARKPCKSGVLHCVHCANVSSSTVRPDTPG